MKKTYKRYTKTKKIVAVALVSAMMLTCLPNVLAVTTKTDKVDSGDKILDGSSDINVLNPNATAVPILEPTVAPTMVPTPSEDEGLALPLPTPISTITTEDVSDETLVSSEKPTLYAKGLETTPDGKPTKDENGYITSTYGYPLKGDPYDKTKTVLSKTSGNYTLQDEKFFGKWNSKAEKWEIAGKFNYDEFPGLSDVQTAVKNGDYEEAKLALYLYYRDKERNGTRPKDTSISTKDRITADLLTENYMYNANSGMEPVTMLTFDGTPKYAGGDVTDILIKKMGARQEITVIVTATNKDGGVIKFNSREGGKDVSPFLKVKVNGTEMNIYPSADTYIKAGGNKGNSYGKEDFLYAAETEINDTVNLVGSDTARTYLKFDISGLHTGDTITAATLNMHGFNSANKEKEIVAFVADDSSWYEERTEIDSDGKVEVKPAATWNNMTAQMIFSYDQLETWPWNSPSGAGYRYPEELLRFNTWVDKLVKLYNSTGDEKYAYTALRQVMDYINVKYYEPRYIKLLDIAVRTQVLPGYVAQLLESEYMTPDVFTGIMKYMWSEANEFGLGTDNGFLTYTSNWGASETLGYFTLAINYPEFSDAPKWIDSIKPRYEKVIDYLTADDYSCRELALGYIDYTLDTTVVGARKVADAIGYTDYPFTEKSYDQVKGLTRFMMYTSMPGYKDNQEGDGYSHRGNYVKRFQYLADWLHDPEIEFAASGGKKGTEPAVTSVMYPLGKKVAMRTSWDDKANYLYTSVDGGCMKGSSGNHAHQDDNNLVVSAYGQYLLVDPLYGSYSANSKVTWMKSSKGHNVVNVNGLNQQIDWKQGSINHWETNDDYDFYEGYSPNIATMKKVDGKKIYTMVSGFDRKILFVKPGFWLVTDYMTPQNENANNYSQAWHFLPEANITIDKETGSTRTNMSGPNIQVVPVENKELDSANINSGWYSEGQGSFLAANYTTYEKKVVGDTVYNTVLYPEKAGQTLDIETYPIELSGLGKNDASAYELLVTDKTTKEVSRYQYYLLHNDSKKALRSVGTHSTDASMLLAEIGSDGKTKSVIASDASIIINDEIHETIFKSESSVAEVSIKWSGDRCMLASSKLMNTDLKDKNAIVYNQSKNIKETLLNDLALPFKQTANYIYFGEKPGDTDPPIIKPTPKPTDKPSHGGGGSSGGGGGGLPLPTPTIKPVVTPAPTAEPTHKMNESMKNELNGHWAEKEISSLYECGIISGVSDDSLGLSQTISRAEFITLVVRALRLDISNYKNEFSDVLSDDWFANYIQTGFDNGLISGFEGKANPNDFITREEMAKILSSAAKKANIKLGDADLSKFNDASEISEWAIDDIKKVVGGELMNGTPEGKFSPKTNAKRDESFVVVYRLVEKIK